MRISLAKGISAVVVSIVMVGTSLAGDAVQSGLKVGEPVNQFLVDDITGPNKGNDALLSMKVRSTPGGLRLRPQDLRTLGQFGQAD